MFLERERGREREHGRKKERFHKKRGAGEREPRVKESNVGNETPRAVRERSELRAHQEEERHQSPLMRIKLTNLNN